MDLREARGKALRARLGGDGLEALLVSHLANIRYLTGFTGSAGMALVLPRETVLVTDFRYETQAQTEAGTVARIETVPSDVWERLWRVLEVAGVSEVGFEAERLSAKDAGRFGRDTGGFRGRWRAADGHVEALRAAKHASEVRAIRAAAELAHEALREVLPGIRDGMTELAVAALLEGALRRRGSEWHPFPTIVASGPRSALPHAHTSGRVIGRGDLLLIDFGARLDGYCADITRTYVVGGPPDERQATVYGLVRDAQQTARERIRPGMSGRDADALARGLIAARGFADAFGHSLGHGLGLEVHEAPRLSQRTEAALPEGAVVTIEPGIYLPGWGGVRIEDDVHLAAGGAELLSDGGTDLTILA